MLVQACGDTVPTEEVVLYYSADSVIAQPIIDAFEEQSGIAVRAVGDTEATKTTGLVQRLRAERDNPRADVFWSSEIYLTLQLAEEGVLGELRFPDDRDERGEHRDGPDALWRAFAQRARVVVYNSERVSPDEAPQSMHDLLDAGWKGRIAMARPQFGTTRGHMAALVAMWGEEGARDWMERIRDNGVRFYDGNASVVRAVASGEALVGLTDTDDVWAGQRNGWPVDLVYVRHDREQSSIGALLIPNTVAVIRGGPNPDNAQRLAEFLLSERVERMLAQSDSHNIPTRPSVAAEFAQYAVPTAATVEHGAVAAAMPTADRLGNEVFGAR